ncbi:LruC domain-containing protein [Polaribacter litorisediminis]|uniref:LruC domain-containing protein n=1 Tax=Polaribacter litorisediminis TaxID=1908341 RepID=UPI001CBB2AB1|nr:LruC domain-containing protein [Polaribacter litorisediminis]UAM98694.1 LruC domain-containing protein [Polaribacter litorisediminis]
MRNSKIIISLLMLTIVFNHCAKLENLVDPDTESLDSFIVPANFDWKTTQTLNVSVVLPNNGNIQPLIISNSSGSKIFFKGYPDDGSRTLNTIITIPSYISELRLMYNGTNEATIDLVSNSSLSYNFNTGSKLGNKSDFSPITLGSIANFAIFASAGAASSAGVSVITGNVGANVGAISGFGFPSVLNGIIENANIVTTQAVSDLNDLVVQIVNTVTTNSNHSAVFGSETLTPGVYAIGAAASIAGTLTLDAEGDRNAQFIFKIGGAFTTAANAKVLLINGASPDNVFWLATGACAMAASTSISGNVIANPGAVSMGDNGKLNGRLLSVTGAVSMLNGSALIPYPSYSGTLAFEDLWPSTGDYDFNDLVVDYDFNIIKNNQEFVQSINASFKIQAFGAAAHNGFGFTLPTVNPNDVVSVSGYDVLNNAVFNIGSNGLENGQSKSTIIVFDDTYRVMPTSTGGTGANTQLAYGYNEPVTIVVNIILADNAITFRELDINSFNPFMIVGTSVNGGSGSRVKEVHLANFEPSDLFDSSLFGQSSDDSSPVDGRYFLTADNLPSAINIAENFDWVFEYQDITEAYLLFKDWAESSGNIHNDWYLEGETYRDINLIYPNPAGN